MAYVVAGCGGAEQAGPKWPPLAKRWYDRALASYRVGDTEDAAEAIQNAMRADPRREEIRVLGARIALTELDYARSLELVSGMKSKAAREIRGRGYWYAGDVERAADELEALLSDPDVRDPWAREVSKLARLGRGRKPFTVSGGLLAVVEMPRLPTAPLLVPLELNGEPALGLIATGTAEAVVDSSGGGEPSWVSLRFGETLEVRDVPALSQDLSGLSRDLKAPIRVLLGINLLRHLNPTFDLLGNQFVARTFEPPPPPAATTLPVAYLRGGGMLLRGSLGAADEAPRISLLVDTAMTFPIALDNAAWLKAGVDPKQLAPVPNVANLKHGQLPLLKLGAFEVPRVPAVSALTLGSIEQGLDMDLDGLLGGGLLAHFRVTLAQGGRRLWLEGMPAEAAAPASEPAPSSGPESAPATGAPADPPPPAPAG